MNLFYPIGRINFDLTHKLQFSHESDACGNSFKKYEYFYYFLEKKQEKWKSGKAKNGKAKMVYVPNPPVTQIQ